MIIADDYPQQTFALKIIMSQRTLSYWYDCKRVIFKLDDDMDVLEPRMFRTKGEVSDKTREDMWIFTFYNQIHK